MPKLDEIFLNVPIAHRGLHDGNRTVDENSVTSFLRASERGFPIEIDIQASRDGKAIVFHDAHLDRMTNMSGRVDNLTAVELAKIKLKNGDPILSLEEICKAIKSLPMLIEIKDQSNQLGVMRTDFIDDILKRLRDYEGQAALMSFNPYAMDYLQEVSNDIPLGLVTTDFACPNWDHVPSARRNALSEMKEISEFSPDFISHARDDLDRVADFEGDILCWTVRSKDEEKEARRVAKNITFELYDPRN